MHGRYSHSVQKLPLIGKFFSANNISLGFALTGVARFLWKKNQK